MPNYRRRKSALWPVQRRGIAEGTVTRLAALKVLEELRPEDTVTICLPLFLAGGEGDRAFARFYPTIAVDGCELRCAARATEEHSGKPAASVRFVESEPVVLDIQQPKAASCACGSGIPVQTVQVNGQKVTLIALPALFEQFQQDGRLPSPETAAALLEQLGIYNPIPAGAEGDYQEMLVREYSLFCGELEAVV
jgi:hypothetical protein